MVKTIANLWPCVYSTAANKREAYYYTPAIFRRLLGRKTFRVRNPGNRRWFIADRVSNLWSHAHRGLFSRRRLINCKLESALARPCGAIFATDGRLIREGERTMLASFAFIKRANGRVRLLRDRHVYDLFNRRRATTRFQDDDLFSQIALQFNVGRIVKFVRDERRIFQ